MVLRILSFLLFAVTLASAYGGRVSPDLMVLPGVAVMILPYLAIASILVTVLWLLAGRWITAGVGILTLIAAWSPISNAMPLHFSKSAQDESRTFTVLTWNCLHTWEQKLMTSWTDAQNALPYIKENKAIEYILDTDADIVCLQELSRWDSSEIPAFSEELDRRMRQKYPYMSYEKLKDTRVFSKYPIRNIPNSDFYNSTIGRSDLGWLGRANNTTFHEVTVKGKKIMLVNTHLYSPMLTQKERAVMTDIKSVDSAKHSVKEMQSTILGKMKQWMQHHRDQLNLMCEGLDKYRDMPMIVCGDFNDVPESYCWRIMTGNGFRDAYADTGFGPLITYNKHLMLFHIDQVFYRGPLKALSVKKGKIKTSDHYPLITKFELTNP